MRKQQRFLDKRQLFLLFFNCFELFTCYSQNIKPNITARVDTSNIVIKEVYNLYKNYLNSRPDSIYKNPYWNESESEHYLAKSKLINVDRSAKQIFSYFKAKELFNYYTPKILQIDSVALNRYQIKTIFDTENIKLGYEKFTPLYITKLYAVRNQSGDFKLENCIDYETRNWKKYQYKYITYVVHPECSFQKNEAKKAVAFCEKIAKQFNIKVKPFMYYLLPSSDEFGKLYNFDYWLSYSGGQTVTPWNEIFTSYGNENFPHEFVHILFGLRKDEMNFGTMIVTEGLATWLSGAGTDKTFKEELSVFSKQIKDKKSLTIDNIINNEYRNQFDNNPLYLTGGVICMMVYEKHGVKGIWELYDATNDNLKLVLEKLFEIPYVEVDKKVMDYIRNYSFLN